MKKLIIGTCIALTMTNIYAEDMVGAVAGVLKAKIEADKEVAISKKQKVTVDNSVIIAKSKMGKDNIAVGNIGGVVAIGEEVEITNSRIEATSEMDEGNIVVGNVGGVVLGAH